MYTPLMGDEKRDIVEYTSFGFMNCAHTMLTYTRAMDSALCVPLMIDAAVFCDYFARRRTPQDRVSRALAYLFKVPEGGAQGVDPGFFKQMRALEEELEASAVGTGEVMPEEASLSAADEVRVVRFHLELLLKLSRLCGHLLVDVELLKPSFLISSAG